MRQPGMQAAVSAAEDRRYAAMVAADTAALADLLSETLIYVHTTGDTDTSESYLDAVAEPIWPGQGHDPQ